MKILKTTQTSFVACSILFLLSCNSNKTADSSANTAAATDTVSYPFKATYSSNVIVPGSTDNAKEVLTVWKMFETKQIAAMKQYYADTVTYEDGSGHRFYGKSDDLLNYAAKDIDGLDSLRFDISMWQSVHVVDKNEDWVYVWAAERRYPAKGVADTSLIHEQWKIEKGKVVYFNKYDAKPVH